MRRYQLFALFLLAAAIILMSLSACNLLEPTAASVPSPEVAAASCPEPGADTLSWDDETMGICLLYPASHTVVESDSGNTEIVVGDVMNHIDPRISIISEELAGRTLAQAVEDFLSGYEVFEIAQSELTLAGEEAVLLDGLPGQDLYRKLFVAHNGSLYQLTFAPYDPNLDNIDQAEQLYTLVTDSFRFTAP